MALHFDDAMFYAQAGTTWLFSAILAFVVLLGWIRGHVFRSKFLHFLVLVYGIRLGQVAIKLRAFLANIPESHRCRCPGPRALGVPSAGECILMEGADVRDLVHVATTSFHLMVVVVINILEKRKPPRPRVGGLGGLGSILIEFLLFVLCVLTCFHSLPVLILDYIAATENRGGAALA